MSGANPNVLVVEDDHDIREMLADVLSFAGYRVKQAANGREALAALQEAKPDLIVLDLLMPDMDGWTFRNKQDASQAAPETPMIIVSGVSNPWSQAEELRAAAVFQKPFDMGDFLGEV